MRGNSNLVKPDFDVLYWWEGDGFQFDREPAGELEGPLTKKVQCIIN